MSISVQSLSLSLSGFHSLSMSLYPDENRSHHMETSDSFTQNAAVRTQPVGKENTEREEKFNLEGETQRQREKNMLETWKQKQTRKFFFFFWLGWNLKCFLIQSGEESDSVCQKMYEIIKF